MNINDFSGAKIAILVREHVLTLLRDDKPGIAHPNEWDLPGGGREGAETPVDCVLRELFEEAALRLRPEEIAWKRLYRNPKPGGLAHWFFVASPGWLTLPPVRLGNEGQSIKWTPIETYLELENAVPHLRTRLRDYLSEVKEKA